MAVTCANGHESEWNDYCSVCGEAIGAGSASPDAPPAAGVGAEGAAEVEAPASPPMEEAGSSCPNCSEKHAAGDVFCENCGYDFLTGTLPDESAASAAGAMAASPAATEQATPTMAVISVDTAFFERMGFEGVDPPATIPEPVRIPLPPTDVLVGRHSDSRGTFPEIDLSSVFEEAATDPAVSSSHCRLHRGQHGWTVTDLDSTNGTYVGDEEAALKPGVAISLTPGTPIYVGAWTRIELLEDAD